MYLLYKSLVRPARRLDRRKVGAAVHVDDDRYIEPVRWICLGLRYR